MKTLCLTLILAIASFAFAQTATAAPAPAVTTPVLPPATTAAAPAPAMVNASAADAAAIQTAADTLQADQKALSDAVQAALATPQITALRQAVTNDTVSGEMAACNAQKNYPGVTAQTHVYSKSTKGFVSKHMLPGGGGPSQGPCVQIVN